LVFPGRLSIDYSYRAIPPAAGVLEPGVLLGGALLVAWGAAAALLWRRAPGRAVAILWVGAALAPVANILFPLRPLLAERLLYLPSAGFCIAVVPALAALGPRSAEGAPAGPRVTAPGVLAILLLLALSARTFARLGDWRDDYTIFKAAVGVAPDSVRAQF